MVSAGPGRAKLQLLSYETLSQYFQAHEDEVVEIEILPPAIEPLGGILMQDGLNLGVPKKTLALAYVEARHRFFEGMHDSKLASSALQATKVMLLFDPEHLTAANFRKGWLGALEAEFKSYNPAVYHKALRQELCFLNSILTSPLHRQSKSPTLWYHRLWLLDLLASVELEKASEDQKATFWRAELTAVCKSGEQHPKNYYAWQYARRLMPKIVSPETNDEFARHVKDWCCRHPSDISGWSFLLSLLPRLHPVSKRQGLVRDILSYAINLRLEHESLWVFIRTILAQETLLGGRTEFDETLQNYNDDLGNAKKASAVSERVPRTLNWINTYREAIAVPKN
ncbi:protein prenylyltransferase [Cucurbitaria berberidis CBS 394.84]|uniref:Protein prenylyltransferase n=1 Tax=Cucurbitaria berberidis CBS 394.84 TaxID=1168544 RepID=A0A9P4GNN4_9PLEO|nr:protein prenylyltransferase [Cucurbitaria berberidis CBS 394.84]KAF1849823.1 protein prenylyltransferase [Cucurbitaria berberidis CBS 394.84]